MTWVTGTYRNIEGKKQYKEGFHLNKRDGIPLFFSENRLKAAKGGFNL
jgi:hypothetical protein